MGQPLPWVKWENALWLADPGVRACGLAARGLWKDMLALMDRCDPYGHLAVNGRSPSNRQLATMVGASEKEVANCLIELEGAGVFSRSEDGLIYSRKMVRDHSEPVSNAERQRRWRNRTKNADAPVTHAVTPPVTQNNVLDKDSDLDKESESDKKESRSLRSLVGLPLARTDSFSEFWKLYPRKKEGPKACEKAWASAIKRADPATIIAGLRRYEFDPGFMAHATTWLNQSRWTCERDTPPPTVARRPDDHRHGAERMIDDHGIDVLTPLNEQFHGQKRTASSDGLGDQVGAPRHSGHGFDLEGADWIDLDRVG